MLRRTAALGFRMKMGSMFVNYQLFSRDHKKSARVEEARVDTAMTHCTAPMHWLDALRSPSERLPTGYYSEKPVFLQPPAQAGAPAASASAAGKERGTNAVCAGPLVMYIVGQAAPVVVNMHFVDEAAWGMKGPEDCDIRVGMEAVEQCTLFSELRPGGLLTDVKLSRLRDQGLMQVGLAESPLARRPTTRMKYMFIDEIQRGPELKEFVGYNPRLGSEWRFSQHCKHFRVGHWRETTRRNELIEGVHAHSSMQRSHQQAVPGVRFMAPSP
jgi:hypothetical protein